MLMALTPSQSELTRVLRSVDAGEESASSRLLPLVYDELRKLAASRLSRLGSDQTLQPTALVHEVYLRLLGDEPVEWANRAHFFAAAANAMRNIIVERARRRGRIKHGGGRARLPLEAADVPDSGSDEFDFVGLDTALKRFAEVDPTRAQVVMLRFFAGLTVEDTAAALGSSPATVKRDWNYARAWLHDAMNEGDGSGGPRADGDRA
jgi:RNA polymerase sigma factor (TIGR02999 family)